MTIVHSTNATKRPRVAVVMSTYNGITYVEEQIASILQQLPPHGQLLIRDDGSSDGTQRVIKAMGDARIHIVEGENIGFANSFLKILASAAPNFDVLMLSDQDDVWLPDKISRACAALQGSGDVPTLYCTRQQLVDASLIPFAESQNFPRGPSFENALCENIVTGCTSAMNKAAAHLVCRTGDANAIYFHDWWFYLVVSAFGRVIYDQKPSILYRQHGGNVIGRGVGIERYLATLAFMRKQSWVQIMYRQIDNFRRVHWDALSHVQQLEIERFFDPCNPRSIARLLFGPTRRRQLLFDEFLFRLVIVAELALGRSLLPERSSDARHLDQ